MWIRDLGRYAFVSADGRRRDSTYELALHPIDPVENGGATTEGNLSLRCRSHDAFHAAEANRLDAARSSAHHD